MAGERYKVQFASGGMQCAAWHYRGTNSACVIMAAGFAVTKEPGTDRVARRFHKAGFTVLAFDYRHLGESAGQPRQVVSVREQLADWQAAIEFAAARPEVDPTKVAVWGFSVSGGHIFRIAAGHPELAAAIAQTPNADGWAAAINASRHQQPLTLLRLMGRGVVDILRGLLGREPRLVPLAGKPGSVAVLTTPDALADEALNPDNRYPDWPQAVAARSVLPLAFYRPGRVASRVRCPLLVLVCNQDQSALAPPAIRAAQRAPRGELVRLPGGHYAPFLAGHEQAIEAELSFLRRHLLDPPTDGRRPRLHSGRLRSGVRRTGMRQVQLSAGTIEYEDTGGDGPVLVLLHGLMMDSSLWDEVIADLADDHRCVAPALPLGAHRHPMRPDADLSLRGIAGLAGEFLERLDLTEVTLVGNDTGGALVQLLIRADTARLSRVVLASCEAFDNFPARLTGTTLALTGRLTPRMFGLFMQQMRIRMLRRLPIAFGWLTKRGDATTANWIQPVLTQPEIRRDAVRVLRAAAAEPHVLRDVANCLPSFDRPALVVWARDDPVMPPEHGRRLAQILPQGRLIEIADSYALIPLDQPARFAQIIREFTGASAAEDADPAARPPKNQRSTPPIPASARPPSR